MKCIDNKKGHEAAKLIEIRNRIFRKMVPLVSDYVKDEINKC
jgi:hypothetical protein